MDPNWIDWVAVAVLGVVVGTSELISRYKDHPGLAIRCWPAIFYIALNGVASVIALALISSVWPDPSRWKQILVSGVGAMAFFRTSLFVVRAGDRDVGLGPSEFLKVFLTAADRAVDRKRAAARSESVAKVMKGIDFAKASKSLPFYCVGLMQNVPAEDQKALGGALEALNNRDAEPSVKALLLGIELINVVGVDVLTTAVNSLGDQIRSVPEA